MSGRQRGVASVVARLLFLIGYPLLWLGRGLLSLFFGVLKLVLLPARRTARHRVSPLQEKKAPSVQASHLFQYDWIETQASTPWNAVRFWWHWYRRPRRKHRQESSADGWPVPPASGLVVWLFFTLVTVGGGVWWSYTTFLADLPSPSLIRERTPPLSTKIYDRNGTLLYSIFEDQNRTLVSLEEISPSLISATLAIEDEDFYEHWGVSFRGIARAFWHNLRKETLHGGSTITQQLVKNTLLSPERTWRRKIRELVLALAVDWQYTKEEILEAYLNEVNYGGSVYGIEEASYWYFNKPARELTLAESAFLAGLPVAPSAYSPFGPQPQRAVARQHEVLARMEAEGFITALERQQAEQQTLTFRTGHYDIQAPHFVMYLRSLLAEQFGEEMVSRGGLEVYTTLDLSVQASAEAALAQEIERLGRLKVQNGAALITDPRSGEILAMVGSKDYFDREHDGSVNVTLRPRQPGSSIKPITYVTAFEKGFTPSTTIEDTPVVYTSPGAPPYSPKNYDGRYHGKVTLREALGSSYNIPAVRLLVEIGLDSMIAKARAMGITTWEDSSRFGLALTLGAGEVRMYDMMQVYGTFANGGLTVPLNPLISVRQHDGRVLYSNPCVQATEPCNARRTVTALAAYQVTSILSDNQARTPAFGPRSVLVIPEHEVAVKTGTTNSLRDNWTFGYTSDRVVGVWVGNNDNTPMSAVASGITGASPIWQNIMRSQLRGESRRFALPVGLTRVQVCRQTGTLPCAACPQVVEEVFPAGAAPTHACTVEMFKKVSTDTAISAQLPAR